MQTAMGENMPMNMARLPDGTYTSNAFCPHQAECYASLNWRAPRSAAPHT